MEPAPARPNFEDYPGADIPHADRLFDRNIAVISGPGGSALIRSNSLLVKTSESSLQDDAKRIIEVGRQHGIELQVVADPPEDGKYGKDDGSSRFVGGSDRPASIAGSYLQVIVKPEVQADRPAVKNGLRYWSSLAVAAAISALTAEGFQAVVNHVFMANTVFMGNPGGYLANPGGYLANPGGYLANATIASPTTKQADGNMAIGLAGKARPTVLILDTGLQTRTKPDGSRFARHELLDNAAVDVHPRWRDQSPPVDPALNVVTDDEDEDDDDPGRPDGGGTVDLAGGHGTFIAGIVMRVCPDADLHIEGALSSFGEGDEFSIAAGIERAVKRLGRPFDVISMSLGAYTEDNLPPASVMDVLERQIDAGTVVVASAGNNASPRPQFPAADPSVVAVGALDYSERAVFSNFGPWVDACAPGVDVASTYLFAKESKAPHRVYEGWATWSGTSFSAPKVAAAILREQSLSGCTAHDAWVRLSSWRKFRVPDLGIVFNIE